jgi:hypothetical protein
MSIDSYIQRNEEVKKIIFIYTYCLLKSFLLYLLTLHSFYNDVYKAKIIGSYIAHTRRHERNGTTIVRQTTFVVQISIETKKMKTSSRVD